MTETYDLAITVKPVYPLAIRYPEYFEETSPLWVPYLIRDCHRYAEYHGMSFALPRPDPIVQDLETLAIAEEQPYIHRLTRLAAAAAAQGQGMGFTHELLHLIWSGEVVGWDEGEHLAGVAERSGLELAAMDAAIEDDPRGYDASIFENQDDLNSAGHWYTPAIVFDGELFFGDSRVDMALWRMKQKGLSER